MVKEVIYTLPPHGDEDQGQRYIGAAWTLVIIALITTVVRVLVRSRLTHNMGWDDYWMIITMIINLVGLGFVTQEVRDGFGRHMYYLTPEQRQNFIVIGWVDWMQTFITIMCCKVSVCLFLLRIKSTKSNYWYMYTLIGCNVVLTIVIVGMFIGICSPPNAYWIVGKSGRCLSTKRVMALVLSQGSQSRQPVFEPTFYILHPMFRRADTACFNSLLSDLRHNSSNNPFLLSPRPPDLAPDQSSPLHPHGRRLHNRCLRNRTNSPLRSDSRD